MLVKIAAKGTKITLNYNDNVLKTIILTHPGVQMVFVLLFLIEPKSASDILQPTSKNHYL